MKIATTLRIGTMWLAIFGMFLPTATFGATPTPVATAKIQDVALRPDRSLHGLVTDIDGQARANLPIQIFQAGTEVANTTTDAEGRFVAYHVRGGGCSVEYPGQVKQYRVWTHNAAPPSACRHIHHHHVCGCKAHGCQVCKCHAHGCACSQGCAGKACACKGHVGHKHGVCERCGCHRHGVLGGHVGPCLSHAFGGLLTSPIGLATVAAAISVPLALNNDNDDANAS